MAAFNIYISKIEALCKLWYTNQLVRTCSPLLAHLHCRMSFRYGYKTKITFLNAEPVLFSINYSCFTVNGSIEGTDTRNYDANTHFRLVHVESISFLTKNQSYRVSSTKAL